ncbi:hypothetical protein ABZ348_33590 [Streptomyces sp. NPDC005963]|uniref:hypothetical protein n=1 Tax=Streptomyces sp. NPDC005963 TaxID=3156721 RepID=UPI0033D2D480
MPDPDPDPDSNSNSNSNSDPRREQIASRAWAEALAVASGDAVRAQGSQGELLAASLEAHRMLSRGLGKSVAVTALGPDDGVLGFAAFVAVYAAEREQQNQRDYSDLGEVA